ncbi:hypothetical protein [Mycolicibacterium pulveris]
MSDLASAVSAVASLSWFRADGPERASRTSAIDLGSRGCLVVLVVAVTGESSVGSSVSSLLSSDVSSSDVSSSDGPSSEGSVVSAGETSTDSPVSSAAGCGSTVRNNAGVALCCGVDSAATTADAGAGASVSSPRTSPTTVSAAVMTALANATTPSTTWDATSRAAVAS